MDRPLPHHPSIENLKKQAKTLLKDLRGLKDEALRRLRAHHPKFKSKQNSEIKGEDLSTLSLHDAQLTLAREYGFPSWTKLKARVESSSGEALYVSNEVRAVENLHLHQGVLNEDFVALPVWKQLDHLANSLVQGKSEGDPGVIFHIKCWLPGWAGKKDEDIWALAFDLDKARLCMAREHGFQSWSEVLEKGGEAPDPNFEKAVDAVVSGDFERLHALLMNHPKLVKQRSAYGHRATLLHYVAANGVETYRQKVPGNAAQIAQLLLDKGADVKAEADMYGGGQTTLHLLLTSAHPAEAGVTDPVARILREAAGEEQSESNANHGLK